MSIVAFQDLRKSYGDTPALRGVTFEVPPGQIFGLLGPNGAGKSTLIRILMDIIRPDSGEVRLFGELRAREHLDRLGYLPEERGLYTKLPVVEVMTYFGALKGLTRAEARRRALDVAGEGGTAARRRLEDRAAQQGHEPEGPDRRDAPERSGHLRAGRADDRARSGERAARAGPAGRAPAERPDDHSLDPPDEPGRGALRPRRAHQQGRADGVRRS